MSMSIMGMEPTNSKKYTQVYLATHVGEISLPYMYRSFISFTFGRKKIEDFNLIATTSGDRLNRKGYADFSDTVSNYDNLDGLYYWSTHHKANQIDFTLSTDGIDQKQLDEFLYWFKPGISRELILAEHPNRAIMARVSTPPTLELLPFELEVSVKIGNNLYPTKTTLYKGDIELTLVMDKPHWYSIVNILGKRSSSGVDNKDRYIDRWDDPFTGELDISIFASQDALKIIYEDGIPVASMINSNMLLGNGAYANVGNAIYNLIWDPNSEITVENTKNLSGGGACIDGTVDGKTYRGIIAGPLVDASDNGVMEWPSGEQSSVYFFYSGTAPAPTILEFTMTPGLSSVNYYVNSPRNTHNTSNPKYNKITITSLHELIFQFTTPNVYTSYNKVIEIFTNFSSGTTWSDLSGNVRDRVKHFYVRLWAMSCIAFCLNDSNNSTTVNSSYKSTLRTLMRYFLVDSNDQVFPVTFSFNSETGEAIGQFKYRKIDPNATLPASINDWASFQATVDETIEEDVGDMLRSNYIIITDKNYPNSDGNVTSWKNTNDTTRLFSHRMYHNVQGTLTNVKLLYKNMYL